VPECDSDSVPFATPQASAACAHRMAACMIDVPLTIIAARNPMRCTTWYALALCALCAACGNREAAEMHKKELAILSAAATPEVAPPPDVISAPTPSAAETAAAAANAAVTSKETTARAAHDAEVAKSLSRFNALVATCAPVSTPKQCFDALTDRHGPEIAGSGEGLNGLMQMLAECRPDITPATCARAYTTMVTDLQSTRESSGAWEAESQRIASEQASSSGVNQRVCDQERQNLQALNAMQNPRPGERYTEEELRNVPRLIQTTRERMEAAGCT